MVEVIDSDKNSIFEKGGIDRISLYDEVRERTAHNGVYFYDHTWLVGLDSRFYAQSSGFLCSLRKNEKLPERIRNSIPNPDICELGGILHDIGYSEDYESDPKVHIERGIVIAREIMEEFGVPEELRKPVLSCIETHDDKFFPGNYLPLENMIVHDINALNYFKFNVPRKIEYWGSNLGHPQPIRGIRRRARYVYRHIFLDYFKELTTSLKDDFIGELNVWDAKMGKAYEPNE